MFCKRGGFAFFLASAVLFLSGCPSLIHVSVPVTPVSGDLPEPEPAYYRHYMELTWDAKDLQTLTTLTVSSPSSAQTIAGTDPTLSVILPMDIQKSQHDTLAADFEKAVQDHSSLDGDQPRIWIPSFDCEKKYDTNGNVIELSGICVGAPMLLLPPNNPVKLDLIHRP